MPISIPEKNIIDVLAYYLFIIKYPSKKDIINISLFMLSHYHYHSQNDYYKQAEIELRKLKLKRIYENK